MGDSITLVTAADLARTYDPPVDDLDGWELTQQHQEALDYAASNPDAGSYAVASAVGAPRGRVRPWIEDDDPAIPDAARGVQTAEERGWIPITTDDDPDVLHAWVTLTAALLAGGSINRHHVPRWAAGTERERDRITGALETLGVEWRDDHADVSNRATEISPFKSSVLGRVFEALGVPAGEKRHADLAVPDWLDEVPGWLRQQFAVVYVANRAEERFPDAEGERGGIRIRENRPEAYLDELAAFLSQVTGEKVTRPGENNVYLSKGALEKLAAFDRRDSAIRSMD
ncbi:MAG: hypothetical protein ABEJ68_07700 [Halobacteriaceae archaeon]